MCQIVHDDDCGEITDMTLVLNTSLKQDISYFGWFGIGTGQCSLAIRSVLLRLKELIYL